MVSEFSITEVICEIKNFGKLSSAGNAEIEKSVKVLSTAGIDRSQAAGLIKKKLKNGFILQQTHFL